MKTKLLSTLVVAILATSISIPSLAQEAQTSTEQTLVEEIRLLREDLRKMAAANLQASLILERVRIQASLVSTLSQQVEQREMSRAYQEMEQNEGWAEDYEKRLRQRLETAGTQEREEIELELSGIRRRVEMEERRRMQEQATFIELQRRLDEATAKLDELFEEISTLQRSLD